MINTPPVCFLGARDPAGLKPEKTTTRWVEGGGGQPEVQAQRARSAEYANTPRITVLYGVRGQLASSKCCQTCVLVFRNSDTQRWQAWHFSGALLWSQAVDCCSSGAARSQERSAWCMLCWAKSSKVKHFLEDKRCKKPLDVRMMGPTF